MSTIPAQRTLCLVYGQFSQVGDRLSDQIALLESLNIRADLSVPMDLTPADAAVVRRWAAAGNVTSPGIYPNSLDPGCTSQNWWLYDETTCTRLLTIAKQKAREVGLGDIDAIDTYTPGNGLIAACKKAGIHFITGFCGPTVANDGHWQICHVGAPLTPFFASEQDYRKPTVPTDREWAAGAWTMLCNMELRSPLTCLENWNEGPFCPLNLMMGDRSIEPNELPIETMAACEDWMRQTELTGIPRIIIVNLQYFTSRRCFDLNRRLLEWLATQRDQQRLQFTGMRELATMQRNNKGLLPQTTWWRGEAMGMHCGGQAGDGNPCIVHEDSAGQQVWRVGNAGPERAFDYQKNWDYPAFDPLGTYPTNEGYSAQVTITACEKTADQVRLSVRWDSTNTHSADSHLCIWDALTNLRSPFTLLSSTIPCRSTPHPAGIGGALLVHCPAAQGTADIVIGHAGSAPVTASRRWNDLVVGETVWLNYRPVTRIAALVPAAVHFSVTAPARQAVRWETVLGSRVTSGLLLPGERLACTVDGRFSASVVRLWDISADELGELPELRAEEVRLVSAAQSWAKDGASTEPSPTEPLRFQAERLQPRWVQLAAQVSATREIAAIEATRAKLFPGTVLAARHMAIDLPAGSATRVRSQDRHDRVCGAPDVLFPIYYDYGQTWAPGVSGWNQFWQIDLGIRHYPAGARLRLVLHAWDPESRGSSLRIFARRCSPDAEQRFGSEITLFPRRVTAQGLDHRHDPEAFWACDLPAALTEGPAMQVTLRGNSEDVRYDRLSEGFGFVCLSHAWLISG